jgi:hypothetical protein
MCVCVCVCGCVFIRWSVYVLTAFMIKRIGHTGQNQNPHTHSTRQRCNTHNFTTKSMDREKQTTKSFSVSVTFEQNSLDTTCLLLKKDNSCCHSVGYLPTTLTSSSRGRRVVFPEYTRAPKDLICSSCGDNIHTFILGVFEVERDKKGVFCLLQIAHFHKSIVMFSANRSFSKSTV